MRTVTALLSILLAAAWLFSATACKRRQQTNKAEATVEESPALLTMLQVADPKAAPQLIKGFYPVERNSWRWTMSKFSLNLAAPANASAKGARLVLRFNIPDPVIQELKSVKLTASVGGAPLAGVTYSQSGSYVYSQDVPPTAFGNGPVAIDFALDKALPPSNADRRELGIVVTAVGFEAK